MPIFEYRCSACDHLEEVLQKHTDPAPVTCSECGKAGTLTKEISATSFQLKGGGWYKDLYASSNKSDAKKSDAKTSDAKTSESTKKEAKSEAKKADTSSSGSSGSSGGSSGSSSGGSSGGSSASSSAAA